MNTETHDERKGLPSASSFARYYRCPGSYQAQKEVPRRKATADSKKGDAIHEAIANETIDQLPVDDQDLAYEIVRLREEVVGTIFDQVNKKPIKEKRLWHPLNYSGKCDYVIIQDDVGLIVDYKTGYVGGGNSATNEQLAGYALLVAHYYGVNTVYVALVQPNVYENKTSICKYDAKDLKQAEDSVRMLLNKIEKSNPSRVAGDHCQYCAASSTCAAAAGWVEGAKTQVAIPLKTLPANVILNRYRVFKAAKKIIANFESELKEMMVDHEVEIPGLALKPGAVRENITEPTKVFQKFMSLENADESDFMEAVSLKKAKLKDILRRCGGWKGKELQTALDDLLDGCVESKQNSPTIIEVEQ